MGAFGGRRDLMEQYDPTQGPQVYHAGTFNANPITMLAGTATLSQLTDQVYRDLDELTEELREGIRHICTQMEVPVQVTGMGSLFGIHFTNRPVENYRDIAAGNFKLREQMFFGLLNEGVLLASNLVGGLSTAIGPPEIQAFLDAFERALERQA